MDETTMELDADDKALAELEAAEQAERDAAEGKAPADAAAAEEEVPEAEAETEEIVDQPQPASDEIRIPKPRLDAVLSRNRDLELENARLRGVEEGLKQGAKPAPAADPGPKTDPAADRLIAIETEKDELWAKVDAGDITFTDVRAAERKLNAEAAQLRDVIAERKRRPAPEPQAADVNGDLRLNEMTTQLAVDNEWIGDIPADYLVASVMPIAEKLLIERGYPITKDPAGAYRMRYMTVEVAKAMGAFRIYSPRERWPAEEGEAAPAAPAAEQPPQGRQRVPAARLTPTQVKEKLQLAARAHPDLTQAGSAETAAPRGAKTIDDMSEDEVAELSEAELERLAPSRAG